MDYQMLNTALGLHSLFASSLVLEVIYSLKRRKPIFSSRFITSLVLFASFSLALLVR